MLRRHWRLPWQLKVIAAAIALLGLIAGINGLQLGLWLLALGGWGAFAIFGYLMIRGFPMALLPRRWREAEDIWQVELVKQSPGSRNWVALFGQAAFGVLGIGGALFFLLAPYESLMEYGSGRGGAPVRMLDALGGEWGVRIGIALLFGCVGVMCVKWLWQELRS